jgi:dehydrogenase/reductase SDR family protein 4
MLLSPQPTSGAENNTTYQRRRFENRYAIVTASTAGIGLAIARRLVCEGAAGVAVCSRRADNVRAAVDELRSLARECNPEESPEVANARIFGAACHVADAEQRRRFLAAAVDGAFNGRLDCLVNNAAANPTAGPLLSTPAEALDKLWEVNVKSALLLTAECAPHLERTAAERRRRSAMSGGGAASGPSSSSSASFSAYNSSSAAPSSSSSSSTCSPPETSCVLFVTSVTAFRPPHPIAAYAVTKTALLGVVRGLADELGPKGIRVCGLAPGIVRTKFAEALVADEANARRQREATVLGRLGTPDDMGGAAAFLLSDDAGYVTGETLVASGGMPSRL